ncbi:HlyD family secretion protein [Hydrogenophaga palleronii]|uniref:HlyD family secretion protein n=1 Tax=Hydrogenophaga palleronii TaxID=65655 RepID=A0ABU1WV03_9BURK|nr:HlyD family efflux transporter periplasmic adaptor subunit [Hydrogenophaga palleronii]MDR7153118.1 HlyD family secretion protein [Hydrogenophaga palleronii]
MNTNKNRTGGLRRWAPWALAAVVVVGLAIWAFQPRPMQVEVASVSVGRFEQVLEEDGQLRLKQRYVIAAPTQAELLRPTLKVGDAVQAGDVVATLAPAAPQMIDARTRVVLQQRVGSADAMRRAAAAQLQRLQTAQAQAALEAERAEKLAQDQFIAPSARDQTALALRSAQQALEAGRAEVRAAEFALAEARAALAQSEPTTGTRTAGLWQLRSPVSGQVIKLHQDSAVTVQAGQALLDIGDTRAIEAVIDVLSTDVPRIPAGAEVALTLGAASPPLQGRVSRIEPVAFTKVSALGIEEQRVNVVVEATAPELATGTALGEGYRVDARITVSSHDDALLVPTAALVRDADQWRVLVVKDGHTLAKPVTVLDRNADMARVNSGAQDSVKQGDQVVLYPGTTIQAGQRVKTRE